MFESVEQPNVSESSQRLHEELLLRQRIEANQEAAAKIPDLKVLAKRGDVKAKRELAEIREFFERQATPPGIRNFTSIRIDAAEVADHASGAQKFLRDSRVGQLLSNAFEFIPFLGDGKNFGDALFGTDFFTGQKLDLYQRFWSLVGAASPLPGRAVRDIADNVRYGFADLLGGQQSRGVKGLAMAGLGMAVIGRKPIMEVVSRQVGSRMGPVPAAA